MNKKKSSEPFLEPQMMVMLLIFDAFNDIKILEIFSAFTDILLTPLSQTGLKAILVFLNHANLSFLTQPNTSSMENIQHK